jgi:hypothetical protein
MPQIYALFTDNPNISQKIKKKLTIGEGKRNVDKEPIIKSYHIFLGLPLIQHLRLYRKH